MNNRFDDKIKESLMHNTQNSDEMKNEIWSKIENHIDLKKIGDRKAMTNSKRYIGVGTAAAVLIFTFLIGTAPGHAAINRIKEIFIPEKTIVEEIEGINEDTDVALQKSKLGYLLYLDEERYAIENLIDKDRIYPKNMPANYPEVYMDIEHRKNIEIVKVKNELKTELETQFSNVVDEGVIESPIKSMSIYGVMGNKWDDTVIRYYIIDDQRDGVFIIKQRFFLEASEGHAVRFDNMLKEFQIIEIEE